MKKYYLIFLMLLGFAGVWLINRPSLADTPLAKELTLTQIKITGDEFVVLHNNTTNPLQLNKYWLQYYNDFNLANSGISNSSTQLPAAMLGPGQEILLASGVAPSCGQVLVGKLSFSLKDTAGLLQVVSVTQSGGLISYRSEDQATWSSKTTDTTDIKGASSNGAQVWFKPSSSANWQSGIVDFNSNCVPSSSSSASSSTASGLQTPTGTPPYIIAGSGSIDTLGMPASDAGLAAPQISEILPNPAPPQSDSEGEFIELYNSNDKVFDLNGFILQTGLTTLHKYTFPEGTTLQPHEFKSFFSSDTGLTLANDSGQVKLLDPSGNVLGQSDAYPTAKDGYSWVSADGLWQWTTTATPNAANVIKAPPSPRSTASSKTSSKTAVKSAKKTTGASTNSPSLTNSTSIAGKLHPLLLAGVGTLAVLYALYEYRHDLANTLHRFRRYRETRRIAG